MAFKTKSVVLLTPNSFANFIGSSFENHFHLLTRGGDLASIPNLRILFNNQKIGLNNGLKSANPMAGYYLQSFLKRNGYNAQTVFDWHNDYALKKALESDPLAICFSTTYVTSKSLLIECIRTITRISGSLPLIIGGPFIWKQKRSILDQSILETKTFAETKIFRDEIFSLPIEPELAKPIYIANEFGEYTLLRVLKIIEQPQFSINLLEDIPNLILAHSSGSWQITPNEQEPVNLDEDYTHWELLDEIPFITPIRTSVGCPYKCRYCDFIELHPKVVMRSPESILKEINLARQKGRNVFNFVDDNLFISKKRIANLTTSILKYGYPIIWGGFFRVDRVDSNNIEKIVKSGCHYGMCGIESGDDEQLKRMGKMSQKQDIYNGIELCTQAGIRLLLTLIVGYPGETKHSLDNTSAMINQLSTTNNGYCSFQIYPFYLLPGTKVDSPEYRRLFSLTGQFAEWSHGTMHSNETMDQWVPYLFKNINSSIPYDYYVPEKPYEWSIAKRNLVFQIRTNLTRLFLDQASDDKIQESFAFLYKELKISPTSDIPIWREFLAARSKQPGFKNH